VVRFLEHDKTTMTPDTALTAILNDEPVPEIWLDYFVARNYFSEEVELYIEEQEDILYRNKKHKRWLKVTIDANWLWVFIEKYNLIGKEVMAAEILQVKHNMKYDLNYFKILIIKRAHKK